METPQGIRCSLRITDDLDVAGRYIYADPVKGIAPRFVAFPGQLAPNTIVGANRLEKAFMTLMQGAECDPDPMREVFDE